MGTNRTQDTDDTVPAAVTEPGPHGADRAQRSTIPDIAPPFEQRYRLGVELGRGGMGRVVEAFDTQLGRTVALKEVLPRGTGGIDRRFEREVQITARLEHPSIVPLYDAGTMPDGRPFYVMRRVTGRPLDELITRARSLEERLALLPNVLAATDAIAHAHKRGIIHRDLKPANVLVGENGETIVIDWGLAKVIGEEDAAGADEAFTMPTAADSLQTVAGAVFGTPGFMAPEQARGEELGPRGDVFALGATLYQLLVGRPPIAGKSATDAIVSSIQRKIVPVAEAAPTAPAELVTIVEKALKFDPADRYANAAGLADDLRNFLTGQVVAAHRYTRRELIKRFAKKHRAPLSVAALATVAVAVLAWIGVHRILVERDAANVARADAESERAKVEKSNISLFEKADQLLITRARALVDSNPTESLALLKEMRPASPRMPEARAIAQAAVMRGVPWALHAEGDPRRVAVDKDVTHLAELTGDGTLHVWDLVRRRVLFERMYIREATPIWMANGKLLLLRGDGAEELDIRSGSLSRVPEIPPSWRGEASDDGQHVVVLAVDGELGMFDAVARSWTSLWPNHVVQHFEIPPDASWIAANDKEGMVALSADGRVLAEKAGQILIESTTQHSVAMFEMIVKKELKVWELDIPAGTWHQDPLPLPEKNYPVAAYYRNENLHVVTASALLHYKNHALSFSEPFVEFSAFMIQSMANDIAITASRDGTLHFDGQGFDGHINMPAPLTNPHLAGRMGVTRFVAAGTGVVFVYDLADILPTMIPKSGEIGAAFIDDDTLLMWPDDIETLYTRDLATGATTPFKRHVHPGLSAVSSDPHTGRMVLTMLSGKDRRQMIEVQKGHPNDMKVFAEADKLLGKLTPTGLLVAHDNDPRVLYADDHEDKLVELAKVDGGVQSITTLDAHTFAALGRTGELVRGAISGGPVDHVRADIDASSFVGVDLTGHALVATGKRLLVWDAVLHPLVELPRAIIATEVAVGGIVITLDNNASYYLDGDGKLHDLNAAASQVPAVGGDGTWIATSGGGGQISVVELPSLARWTLPRFYSTQMDMLAGSPSKRRLLQGVSPNLAVFELLQVKGDLATWLDDRTNAFESNDGLVSWPWLRP